jgi:hypothetical protein
MSTYPRPFTEKDYTRIVIGIVSWWLSNLNTQVDPELVERLAKAIVKGPAEINVLKTIGETRINRFYVRHNMLVDPEDACGFGCWVNVFDRDGSFMTQHTRCLTDCIGYYVRL